MKHLKNLRAILAALFSVNQLKESGKSRAPCRLGVVNALAIRQAFSQAYEFF